MPPELPEESATIFNNGVSDYLNKRINELIHYLRVKDKT